MSELYYTNVHPVRDPMNKEISVVPLFSGAIDSFTSEP